MVEAVKNLESGRFICPCCEDDYFIVFRRDRLSDEGLYLYHSRCLKCNQLFVFKVRRPDEDMELRLHETVSKRG